MNHKERMAARYTQPLEDLFWRLVNDLGILHADAHSLIETVGKSRPVGAISSAPQTLKILIALTGCSLPSQVSSVLGIKYNTASVAASITQHRKTLYTVQCVAKHWDWLSVSKIDRATVADVTYLEWSCFDANPFVLLPHAVDYDVLAKRPATPETRRYGLVLALLCGGKKRRNDTGTVSVDVVLAELEERGISCGASSSLWDVLRFDPANGRLADHPAFLPAPFLPSEGEGEWEEKIPADEDPSCEVETFSQARARTSDKLTYGEYKEYQRVRNRIVYSKGFFHLRETFGAAERCARWCAERTWQSCTADEKDALIKRAKARLY
jgi:hypothetical protein